MKRLLVTTALVFLPAASALAVYCGNLSVSGGGGTGSGGNPLPCFFWVASSGGSDGNTGRSPAVPFATLERARTAMEGLVPASSKVTCLKAGSGGTYNRTALLLTVSDNGETWQFDPVSGVNTAILDGGGTNDLFDIEGATNVTINGIKIQNFGQFGILADGTTANGPTSHITIENSDIGNGGVANGGPSGGIAFSNVTQSTMSHNYIHDTQWAGTNVLAFSAGNSWDGDVVTGNVLLRNVQGATDVGAISSDALGAKATAGTLTISNNFVRDYGSAAALAANPGPGTHGIYLDDFSSNATVNGNIVGPPTAGIFPSTIGAGISSAFFFHNGKSNVASGNIVDLGNSSFVSTVLWGGDAGTDFSGSVFSNNIILSNFAGPLNTLVSGVSGFAYFQGSPAYPASDFTIQNNVYHNYGGGAENSSGNIVSDGSPQHFDPLINGYLYAIDSTSGVFSQISFPPIVGGWGPPGFIIPTSTNHSNP